MCGASPQNPPGAGALARRLLGDGALAFGEPGQHYPAILFVEPGRRWRIRVRRDLTDPEMNAAIAEALLGWAVHVGILNGPASEELVAALLLPMPALREAVHERGLDVDELAAEYVLPRRLALLRIQSLRRPPVSGVFPRFVEAG